MSQVWLNGKFVEEGDASVSLRDTGLLHAAGVFTTMRSYRGRVHRIQQHLKRLRASCEVLFVPLMAKDDELIDTAHELLRRNELSEARLRLTVTRGQASDDPIHGVRLEPNAFITTTALEPYPAEFYEHGMTVMLLDEQRLNAFDIQAGHKTLNYFSRLAGLKSANRSGAGEALWFNAYYNALESGSITNVFIVREGTLLTPPTNEDLRDPAIRAATAYPRSNVLPGITRGAVLELAKQHDLPTAIKPLNVDELLEAEEVFLTNSIMQIMPVCRIEKHAVGKGQPGDVTLRLTQLYREAIDAETAV